MSKPKEVCQMQVIDAVDTAAARPLVKTDNIFGIIVTYSLQIAELTLTGRFVRHDISGLYIYHLIIATGDEVNFTSTGHLSRKNLIAFL